MSTIGSRLREERDKLGMNQTDFAKLGGQSRGSQAYYERDERSPDARYLSTLSRLEVDVLYVLTGRRTPDIGDITNDEIELIKLYRSAPLAVKAAVLAALTAGSNASNSIHVSGQGNRVAGNNFHENKK
ncbi:MULTISPECIES: helix-turn-helix domain-containing protein [Symbiopectobacterium]|uniref:helix-turn-helix domain-containing protein n=1 Tax=Symbiopectobacterium TaxID=801 RepID=UPI001A251016|nr:MULTISPECIES: helix-turn-helix domain-containing protein [Symbiopectobacterium]MBG6247323.1 helix-turn-helix domain-containing protein [Candidatus Symbiopectobacterium sp. PLON1]MBT9429495.1 helix-turn-helix domain-containing protein [Candidatus Symbiopectobacterium endolongispinus]